MAEQLRLLEDPQRFVVVIERRLEIAARFGRRAEGGQRDRFGIERLDAMRLGQRALVVAHGRAQISLSAVHLASFVKDVPHAGDDAESLGSSSSAFEIDRCLSVVALFG